MHELLFCLLIGAVSGLTPPTLPATTPQTLTCPSCSVPSGGSIIQDDYITEKFYTLTTVNFYYETWGLDTIEGIWTADSTKTSGWP